jgi:hypothetical protein
MGQSIVRGGTDSQDEMVRKAALAVPRFRLTSTEAELDLCLKAPSLRGLRVHRIHLSSQRIVNYDGATIGQSLD